jgi:protein-L-isoaspartate O-methyltransferase
MRLPLLTVAAVAATLAPAFAQTTTRIETRPYYGATVTVEKGVRVWRALPPHDKIIINPGGRTPINLTVTQPQAQAPVIQNNSNTVITPSRRLRHYAD